MSNGKKSQLKKNMKANFIMASFFYRVVFLLTFNREYSAIKPNGPVIASSHTKACDIELKIRLIR